MAANQNYGEIFHMHIITWYLFNSAASLLTGVYISKTSYVRQGERNLDMFYRPYHLVEYYRYMRFFMDGTAVVHTSADEPLIAIPRLKLKHGGGNPSVSVGHYRLSGDKVCSSSSSSSSYCSRLHFIGEGNI